MIADAPPAHLPQLETARDRADNNSSASTGFLMKATAPLDIARPRVLSPFQPVMRMQGTGSSLSPSLSRISRPFNPGRSISTTAQPGRCEYDQPKNSSPDLKASARNPLARKKRTSAARTIASSSTTAINISIQTRINPRSFRFGSPNYRHLSNHRALSLQLAHYREQLFQFSAVLLLKSSRNVCQFWPLWRVSRITL